MFQFLIWHRKTKNINHYIKDDNKHHKKTSSHLQWKEFQKQQLPRLWSLT